MLFWNDKLEFKLNLKLEHLLLKLLLKLVLRRRKRSDRGVSNETLGTLIYAKCWFAILSRIVNRYHCSEKSFSILPRLWHIVNNNNEMSIVVKKKKKKKKRRERKSCTCDTYNVCYRCLPTLFARLTPQRDRSASM